MTNHSVRGCNARVLDRVEQAALLLLYAGLLVRLWPKRFSWDDWFVLLLFLSEGAVVLLILLRRPTGAISLKPRDWALGVGGTFLALLVGAGGAPLAPIPGLLLMLIGMFIHVGAKLSLWRSFGVVAAHRGVRTEGLYRFVRHPMYAGYIVSHIGFLLLSPSIWNLAVYVGVWCLLLLRIEAEERVLGQDDAYQAFCARVRHRLAPGLY